MVEFPCRHLQINGPLAPSASESYGDGRDGACEGREGWGLQHSDPVGRLTGTGSLGETSCVPRPR